MGNQQERLIWLAGFIDGEGCFGMVEQQSGGKYGRHVTPRVLISNTNVPALRLIEGILEENGLAYYVGWREPGQSSGGRFARKYLWTIQIAGAKRINRFLEIILPYLVVKAEQASAIYDWSKWVVARPRVSEGKHDGSRSNANKYLEADREVKARVMELNQNPQRLHAEHLNKYTGEDIVRSLAKSREASGNV